MCVCLGVSVCWVECRQYHPNGNRRGSYGGRPGRAYLGTLDLLLESSPIHCLIFGFYSPCLAIETWIVLLLKAKLMFN